MELTTFDKHKGLPEDCWYQNMGMLNESLALKYVDNGDSFY